MKWSSLLALASCALAAFAPLTAEAAAFGVEMGTPLSQLRIVETFKGDMYSVAVPSPHSEFESYTVWAPPSHGVCKIIGVGKNHTGDRSGVEIRTVMSEFRKILTEKYGKSETFDFLESGSIWDEPEDFGMALTKKEYNLATYWTKQVESTMPADVGWIKLEAFAISSSITYLTLVYESSRIEECVAPGSKADRDAL